VVGRLEGQAVSCCLENPYRCARHSTAAEPKDARRATGETELVWPLQQYRFLYIIIIVVASDWSEFSSTAAAAAAAATTTAAAATAACASIALVLATDPAPLVTYYY